MKCPGCNAENRKGASFCLQCGAKLVLVCSQCGEGLPPEAVFCDACGTRVIEPSGETSDEPAPSPINEALQRLVPKEYAERLLASRGQVAHERRLVTILFSDVKGSTAMAENLDPEDVLEIMNGALKRLIRPIYRYEGTLARLMGDAILAFFGAPIAHEDDPERACRAALEILAGAKAYAAKLEQERGITGFDVRVGINTGQVVVGEVGSDLRVEYTAMGDAINLAARMEQIAPPGGILISHDTYRHVRGVFDVQAQTPVVVKGRTQPVQTYIVQRVKPRAWRMATRGVEGIETRMIGRDAELLILQNAYRDTAEGAETRVITVVGEAGVGKSRLLDEFDNWIELLPQTIWYFKGRAAATTQAVPYNLLRDLFAYRFDIFESDSPATALAKFRQGVAGILAPERADLVGQMVGFDFEAAGSGAVSALLGSPSFGQLARAYLVQYVREMVRRQPAAVFLEDLHWADDSSLDLVAHLVAEIPKANLLVLGAARPVLFERRPHWGEGQAAYSRLELRPLSKRATRALVTEILQRVRQVPEALRELVVEGAEGNPFYVEELIKMLADDGVIVREEEAWQVQLERLAEVRVPPTLRAVLQARVDSLPWDEREVLQRASVVGEVFWDGLVGDLLADVGDRSEVTDLLRSLRQRELVFRRERSALAGVNEYVFKHSMLRDVTYDTVLTKTRRRYHAQVARWLEVHTRERRGEHLSLIAGHYELAGDTAKAADYLRRSGEEAYKVSAYHDATGAFKRALRLLGDDLRAERARLLVALGQAQMRISDLATTHESLHRGLALAQALGEQAVEAEALIGLGEVAWRQGYYDTAGQHLEAGLAAAGKCANLVGQARATQHLARVAWLRGQYDESIRLAERSQALYGQIGDRQGLAAALNELGAAAWFQKDFDRSRRWWTDSLTLCQEVGDRRGTASALNNLGEVARGQRAYEEAYAYYQQARAIFREIGDRVGAASAVGNLGTMCVERGQHGAAWGYLRQGIQECASIQMTPRLLCCLAQAARLRARAGQPEQAAEWLGLALHHPASDSDTLYDAKTALDDLRRVLPPDRLDATLARGATLDLETVVAEILAQPAPEVPGASVGA